MVEIRGFLNTSTKDPLHGFRRDSYPQIELARYFQVDPFTNLMKGPGSGNAFRQGK